MAGDCHDQMQNSRKHCASAVADSCCMPLPQVIWPCVVRARVVDDGSFDTLRKYVS